MLFCMQCKSAVIPEAQFCSQCGAALHVPELAPAGAPRAHGDLRTQKMPDKAIGPYRVLRVLRADDNVYVAEADRRGSDAAKKCIVIESQRSLPKLGFRDGQQLAQLKNILPLLNQTFDERGVPFIVVGFMPGEPLDLIPSPLEPPRALTIGLQLATIVDFLHQHNYTFNLTTPHASHSDSLKRFQRMFLFGERDRIYFYDHSALMPLPSKNDKAKHARMSEDTSLIVRTFLRILTGNPLGKIVGFLTQDSDKLINLAKQLVQNPPTNARNLVGAFSQMMPPEASPGSTVKLSDRAAKPLATQKLPAGLQLVPFAQTDVGKQRDHNEDNFLFLPMGAESGLFVVADGMGGHAAGEVASQVAVDEIKQLAQRDWANVAKASAPEQVRGFLNMWIQNANRRIIEKGRELGNNMGSTLTAALIVNRQVYAANVGDSRTYLFRGGELYPLTWDHSLVASLVRAGLLEPEGVYDHPQRNEIFRSLGQQEQVKADVFEPVELTAGDVVLLCSDGLWEMARPPQIKEILMRESDPAKWCAELVRAANDQGGEDNITVVLVRVV